jgi:hypothetical protein
MGMDEPSAIAMEENKEGVQLDSILLDEDMRLEKPESKI